MWRAWSRAACGPHIGRPDPASGLVPQLPSCAHVTICRCWWQRSALCLVTVVRLGRPRLCWFPSRVMQDGHGRPSAATSPTHGSACALHRESTVWPQGWSQPSEPLPWTLSATPPPQIWQLRSLPDPVAGSDCPPPPAFKDLCDQPAGVAPWLSISL